MELCKIGLLLAHCFGWVKHGTRLLLYLGPIVKRHIPAKKSSSHNFQKGDLSSGISSVFNSSRRFN
jgi:hypothetical protein